MNTMETRHNLFFSDSRDMSQIKEESVDLIVTSPAYPMIEMWDPLYGNLNPEIAHALTVNKGDRAFQLMHKELDKTWSEARRVLKKGGIACINIGDTTRTIRDSFQLYSNHSRIIRAFTELGFSTLPLILWHKKTNAPNKFMGSGMLPAGAYVTLEHEYILVFRKGPKRIFKTTKEKSLRKRNAFFWEERNKWFSDIWFDLPGVPQKTTHDNLRLRSAAFPFELAYRLINMYSIQSDTVLDPFLGTGTTLFASLAAGRNSIGFEMDSAFRDPMIKQLENSMPLLNERVLQRLQDHIQFVKKYNLERGDMKYKNRNYGFPVMTRQETLMELFLIESLESARKDCISAKHSAVSKINKEEISNIQPEMI